MPATPKHQSGAAFLQRHQRFGILRTEYINVLLPSPVFVHETNREGYTIQHSVACRCWSRQSTRMVLGCFRKRASAYSRYMQYSQAYVPVGHRDATQDSSRSSRTHVAHPWSTIQSVSISLGVACLGTVPWVIGTLAGMLTIEMLSIIPDNLRTHCARTMNHRDRNNFACQ
jgi:hypothetical protein